MNCIWCKRATRGCDEPEEHIFPDSLGCPADLVFRRGEVCERCNHRNGRLDQALTADFDVFRMMFGVPNKKGRPPTVSTRANAKGRYVAGEPHLIVNMDPKPVADPIGNLAPYAGRPDDLTMSMIPHGMAECEMTLTQRGPCNSKASVRALHKVALSLLARDRGLEHALSDRYDAARRFVLSGAGDRTAIIMLATTEMEYRNVAYPPIEQDLVPIDIVRFRLVVVNFAIDLSPDQEHVEPIKSVLARALGCRGWTWAPIHEAPARRRIKE